MRAAVIAFTRRGAALGRVLADGLCATLHAPGRFAGAVNARSYESLETWTAEHWRSADALVFIGAAGIAVRAVAPHVKDKFTDPAVVSVDELGRFAVPLLSGHVGGANELAARIAALTGAQAVVSTATDVNGLFAVDVWARKRGMDITDRTLAREISAALLEGKPVGFKSDFGHARPGGLTARGALGVWVTCRTGAGPFEKTLRLVPRVLTLGVGCRRGTAEEAIAAVVDEALEDYDRAAVAGVATIDLKKNEAGLLALCTHSQWPLTAYTAEALAGAAGAFTSSSFVRDVTGVDNVCERAAVLASGGDIVIPKRAKNGVTVAVAQRSLPLGEGKGGETL